MGERTVGEVLQGLPQVLHPDVRLLQVLIVGCERRRNTGLLLEMHLISYSIILINPLVYTISIYLQVTRDKCNKWSINDPRCYALFVLKDGSCKSVQH